MMRGIAFYGKGGIGKSTALSNVIASLSASRRKILQIGCDPKHDSTRLLLGGFTQTTVLEQLNTTGTVSLGSVMLTGYNGVKCIESGGPEPGVGCAGRGIIQTLQLLRDQGLDTKQFDYVFFDVLGDVVCGGFAVPMRDGYADEVYIVTSGEIASIYAANNIAKGLKRFATSHGKLGGIIGNERGTRNEREVIENFAKKIGTKMIAFIPRSDLISQAELHSKTITEFAPDTDLAKVFLSIADHIERHQNPVIPSPLSENELDSFLHEYCYDPKVLEAINVSQSTAPKNNAHQELAAKSALTIMDRQTTNKKNQNACDREPVHGCSLSGAFNVISQIKDAVALMYSPQGCSYLSFCTHLHQSSFPGSESPYLPNLLCTNMNATDVIFGGTKNLEETLYYMQKRFPLQPIFLITSCPAGIIGDDVDAIVAKLTTEKQKIFHISSDGVMGGDFYSGMFNAYQLVAKQFIDDAVSPENDTVNIVGEQNLSTTANLTFQAISQILTALGLKINCRFIRQTSLEGIRNFKKAKANIPIITHPTISALTDYLDTHFNTETIDAPIPIAFKQTAEFTRAIAQYFGKESLAERLIEQAKISYEYEIAQLRPNFAGKKALIINSHGCNIDWLISTLADLQFSMVKVSLSYIAYSQERPIPKSNNEPKVHCSMTELEEAIRQSQPDFVLTTGPVQLLNGVACDSVPVLPLYGFNSGLDYAKKLHLKLKIPLNGSWRHDEKLFKSLS